MIMLSQQLETIVANYAKRNLFSGVVRIKQADITLYEGAFGYACKAFKTPNRIDYKFATASITKLFTALAVLQLVESGKLKLDDKLGQYIDLTEAKIDAAITIEQLLTHTSGIADYFDVTDPDGFAKLFYSLPSNFIDEAHKLFPLFMDEAMENPPGSYFSYSGAGYLLLGRVIEVVSGQDYYSYMREAVFKANLLYETDFIAHDHVVENVAHGYIAVKDHNNQIKHWQKNIYALPVRGLADSGAFSTAKDMIKFLRMIRNNQLLSPEMTACWLKPRIKVSAGLYYGLGIWLSYNQRGELVRYGHSGEAPGVSTRLYHYPKENVDLVLFSNHGFSTADLLSELESCLLNFRVI